MFIIKCTFKVCGGRTLLQHVCA